MNFPDNSNTCWATIRDAAAGDRASVERFARIYEPVVKGYLRSRWRNAGSRMNIDDAMQDVFLECLRPDGALQRVEQDQGGGFRAFLYGVVRNVAMRHESRRRVSSLSQDLATDDSSLGRAFDRQYAQSIMREASLVQAEHAARKGPAAERRLQLLRLRFQDGLPIREIATQWEVDPAWLHHEYATARDEFRVALREVVRFHQPDASDEALELACAELIQSLR